MEQQKLLEGQAHVFVAALAFLLDRLLEKKLKAAKLSFSPKEALTHLRTVQRRPKQTSLALNTAESRRETNMGGRILSALRVGFMEPWKPKNSS
ncbi:hypothetical protein A7Q09_08590 [Methylacidiphilum sp. Yel]|nr:hypothetical protein A7Q09_08590 [Methylacidiphilum sp. Yel]